MTDPFRVREKAGDLLFTLYERQERIADRLNRKIERLEKRLTKIEERMGG
jgi:chaperonin cofactor prefoldin